MSDFTLSNGLINVGGILTETKVRKTRASAEALQGLGLDPTKEYKSSIGIASVQEYLIMFAEDQPKNQTIEFPLSLFEQSVCLKSIYTGDAEQDKFMFEIWRGTEKKLFTQTFQRTEVPIQVPEAPLPPTAIIKFTPEVDIAYIQLCFVPCDIIGAIKLPADAEGDLIGLTEEGSSPQ